MESMIFVLALVALQCACALFPEIQSEPEVQTLEQYVATLQFESFLDNTMDLVVFGPSNAAFDNFFASLNRTSIETNENCLRQIVLSHITTDSGITEGSDLSASYSMISNFDLENVELTGVMTDDIAVQGMNGTMFITPNVIDVSIAGVISAFTFSVPFPDLTMQTLTATLGLLSLETSTDYLALVTNPCAELTVFAPSDDAFQGLSVSFGNFFDNITASPSTYNSTLGNFIISSHLVQGGQLYEDVEGQTVTSLSGATLEVDATTVGGAQVGAPKNRKAGLSYVHVLDEVILPGLVNTTIAEAAASSGLSSLVAAITAAGLVDTFNGLQDDGSPFTVFAPTNAAFEEAASALGYDSAAVSLYCFFSRPSFAFDKFPFHRPF